MIDRIKARIQQLEQEQQETALAFQLRMHELKGSIAALQDVLVALTREADASKE